MCLPRRDRPSASPLRGHGQHGKGVRQGATSTSGKEGMHLRILGCSDLHHMHLGAFLVLGTAGVPPPAPGRELHHPARGPPPHTPPLCPQSFTAITPPPGTHGQKVWSPGPFIPASASLPVRPACPQLQHGEYGMRFIVLHLDAKNTVFPNTGFQ